MNDYVITEAQYRKDSLGENCGVFAIIGGVEMHVPLDPANRHYAAIKAKHDDADDSFTIQDAD